MRSGQSSVHGFPSSVLLIALAICSFLFYGVVGQDKAWLLAPVYVFSYALISIALVKRAVGKRHSALGRKGRGRRSEVRSAEIKHYELSTKQ